MAAIERPLGESGGRGVSAKAVGAAALLAEMKRRLARTPATLLLKKLLRGKNSFKPRMPAGRGRHTGFRKTL